MNPINELKTLSIPDLTMKTKKIINELIEKQHKLSGKQFELSKLKPNDPNYNKLKESIEEDIDNMEYEIDLIRDRYSNVKSEWFPTFEMDELRRLGNHLQHLRTNNEKVMSFVKGQTRKENPLKKK